MNLIEIHPIAYNPFTASQAIMTAKAATAAIRIKADELKVTVTFFSSSSYYTPGHAISLPPKI